MSKRLKAGKTVENPYSSVPLTHDNSYLNVNVVMETGIKIVEIEIIISVWNSEDSRKAAKPLYKLSIRINSNDESYKAHFVNVPSKYVGSSIAVCLKAQAYNYLNSLTHLGPIILADWEDVDINIT